MAILFDSILFLHIINDYIYAYAYAYAYTYAYAYDYDSASDHPLVLVLLWSRALLEALEKAEKLQISETYARHYDLDRTSVFLKTSKVPPFYN